MAEISFLKSSIEEGFSSFSSLNQEQKSTLHQSVEETISLLDSGVLRVASLKENGQYETHAWLKLAILLSFRLNQNQIIEDATFKYYDKVPLKFDSFDEQAFLEAQIRVVPGAVVRRGAFIAPQVILMPSFVNIGAFVDEGTMVDTWASVGSCAQIGKRVHLSGGVGIGGVLEPANATPTIIEDDCFIGARSEIVEGVIVRRGAVISMGVYIGQSTKILDRENKIILQGEVPEGSVVVPGGFPSKDGTHSLYGAVIVKRVDEKTRAKVGLNAILREATL